MSSDKPWSDLTLKATPVNADKLAILDSEDTDPDTINKTVTIGSLPVTGEINTASNLGSGDGIFAQKSGVDLEFKSLIGETDKIVLTASSTDITFTLGSDVVTIDKANTYEDFAQTFADDKLFIQNPAITATYQIIASAITANRTLTIPLLTTNDTFVTANFVQTLTNKTLTAPVISTITNSGTLTLPTSTDTLVGQNTTDTLTNKTLTTPTISSFVNAQHNHQAAAGGSQLTATLALTATGTKNSTTFLRGDDTWDVPPDTSGITSLNSDTAAAQTLLEGTGISVVDATPAHTFSVNETVITSRTEKTSIVSADQLLISDSADSDNLKRLSFANFAGSIASTQLSDTANIAYLNTANAWTIGLQNFSSVTLRIPVSVAPTIAVNGDISYDTTVTDFSTGLIKFFGTEEQGIVAMPIAEFTVPTDANVVSYNATNDAFELVTAGTGNVVGPASATDNAIARFNLTTGKLIQNSVVIVGDTGNITGLGTLNTHTIPSGTSTFAILSDNLSVFASTTSAQLAGVINDETGSGALVFGTSPTLTTPVISTITNSGTLTLPTGTHNLVGRATTDILTNKTISAASNTLTIASTDLTDSAAIVKTDQTNVFAAFLQNFSASSMRAPISAAPTITVNGDFAIDSTVTDFSHGIMKYFGGEEIGVVGMPIGEFTTPTDGFVVTYNATSDEFELAAAGVGGGDVVGPASATDNAITRFSGTTGKLIQNGVITIDDVANMAAIRSLQFTTHTSGPGVGTTHIALVDTDFHINTTTGNNVQVRIQGVNEYQFDATSANFNGNNLTMGTAFIQFSSISEPGVTGSDTVGKVFMDSGNSNHLSIRRNSTAVDLEALSSTSFIGFTADAILEMAGFKINQQNSTGSLLHDFNLDTDTGDNATIGTLRFIGQPDGGGSDIVYASIKGTIVETSDVDGKITLSVMENDSFLPYLTLDGDAGNIIAGASLEMGGLSITNALEIEFKNGGAGNQHIIEDDNTNFNFTCSTVTDTFRFIFSTTPNFTFAQSTGFQSIRRIQEQKGANVAAAAITTLGNDGNTFGITVGTGTINQILATNWQAGAIINLQFLASVTVTNNSGGTNDIILADGSNMSAVSGDILTLIFDGTDWIESSRNTIGNVTKNGASVANTIATWVGTGNDIQDTSITISGSTLADVGSIQVAASGKISLDGAAGTSYIEETSNDIVDIFAGGKRGGRFHEGTDGVDVILAGTPGSLMSSSDTEGFLHLPTMGNASKPTGTPTAFTAGNNPTVLSSDDGSMGLYVYNGTNWQLISSPVGVHDQQIQMSNIIVSPTNGATATDVTPSTGVTFPSFQFPTDVDRSIEFDVILERTRDISKNPDIILHWYRTVTDTSDTVVWEGKITRVSQTDDVSALTYGTASTDNANALSEPLLNVTSIEDVDDDAAGKGAMMHCKVTRLGTDVSDTLDGNAILIGVTFRYRTEFGAEDVTF